MRVPGSIALVTGASSGIGESLARQLAGRGAQVLVHGRDPERTAMVARHTGGAALVEDLAEPGAAGRLAERAREAHGRVDLAVLNAGSSWSGPITEMPVEEIDRVLTVDLVAAIGLVHALLPEMVARGSGHIVLIGSVAGRTGVAGEAVYGAAKAGIVRFADALRLELHGTGVGVSLIVPGAVETAFFDRRGRGYARRVPRPVPAGRVAEVTLQAIERNQAERWVPRWLRIAPMVQEVAPGLFRRASACFGEQVRAGVTTDPQRRDGAR